MDMVNKALLEFFMDNYKPGLIGLTGSKDLVGRAVREGQRSRTANGKPSRWSHAFILGHLRPDRRGENGGITKSMYIFESDLRIKPFKTQIRNGAQENWIGKWCKTSVEHAAVIDFGPSDEQVEGILATALQLVDEQVLYPLQELLGTWWAIITEREWKQNPLDNRNAMYCSSFVRYCYQRAGKDFLGASVSVSNTSPEDIGRAAEVQHVIKTYSA